MPAAHGPSGVRRVAAAVVVPIAARTLLLFVAVLQPLAGFAGSLPAPVHWRAGRPDGLQLLDSDPLPRRSAGRSPFAVAMGTGSAESTGAVRATPDAGGGRRRLLWASLFAAGILGGAAANSFTDHPDGGFHVTQEGWFGESTYVGGADKVSHFVSFYIIARELPFLFEYLGYRARTARWMGFGVSSAAGLMIELGDGTNQYGFSFEHLLMAVLGAGTAALVSATDTDDLVGFRFGWVPGPGTPSCCRVNAIGRDYSHEIYTMDLKLAGVVRRLGLGAGPVRYLSVPARYLLVSLTYGVKGYPYSESEFRQRQIGFQVGLNLWEPLYELGVRTTTWWGIVLDTLISNVQYPYTAVGYQYDLNHGKVHGPGIGNSFFPRQ